MARQKRSQLLAEMIPQLPSNNPKGRGRSVTSRIVEVIVSALPLKAAYETARTAFQTFKGKTMDSAIAQAGAMCAQDVLEYVLPKAPAGSQPERVFKEAFGAQWSVASGEIVTHLLGGDKAARKASDAAREAAQEQVDGLRQSWSRAQNVMWFNRARPKVLAAFAKTGKSGDQTLATAYAAYRKVAGANKPVSETQLLRLAERVNALDVDSAKRLRDIITNPAFTGQIAKAPKVPARGRKQVA